MTSPVSVTEVLSETFARRNQRSLREAWSRVPHMYWAAAGCLLHAVAMGFAVGYSAPATYSMRQSRLKPSDEQISWIGSVLALGAMLGGILGGPLSDNVGRRAALLLNVLVMWGGWFCIVQAQVIAPVVLGRFVCGVACGVVSVAAPAYCLEIATPDARGLLGSLFQTASATGAALCLLFGQALGWESLALVSAGAAGAALLFFAPMPESPKWWLARGDRFRAHRALRRLQGANLDVDRECDRIHEELQAQPQGNLRLREWLNPVVWKPAGIILGLMLFQQCSGANAVLYYSTQIFDANKAFLDPNTASVVLGLMQVAATFASNLLVDRAGRKLLLLLSGAIMGLSELGLAYFYYEALRHKDLVKDWPWIPLLCVCVFIVAFSLGFGPLPWLLAAEMVPLRARSRVGGLATFANGLFAFLVTKTFSLLQGRLRDQGVFLVYGVVSCLSCVFVLLCVPETKGKELAQIAEFFCKNKQRRAESLREILTDEIRAITTLPPVPEESQPRNRAQSAPATIRLNNRIIDVSALGVEQMQLEITDSTKL